MEKKEILDWVIEFDFELTNKYYEYLPYITDRCTCLDCDNYEEACEYIIPEMTMLSKELGIDLKKPCDLFYCTDYDDGTCLYWAGYDVIGRIVKGDDKVDKVSSCSIKKNSRIQAIPQKRTLANGFEICFYSLPPILIDGLEYPRITLDFNGIFLRVLKEN